MKDMPYLIFAIRLYGLSAIAKIFDKKINIT